MNLEQPELESKVIGSFEQMIVRYRRLDELTQTMLSKLEAKQSIEFEIYVLSRERNELKALEEEAAPFNQAYRGSRKHASEAVKSLTAEATGLITKVIAAIAILESSARDAFKRLSPEIDLNVRGNQMKQAYGGHGS